MTVECVCEAHRIIPTERISDATQMGGELSQSIPQRPISHFILCNLDPTLDVDLNALVPLQVAANAAWFWLSTSDPFKDVFSTLFIKHSEIDGILADESINLVYLQKASLKAKYEQFLASNPLPKIMVVKDIHVKYDVNDTLYGLYDGREPDQINIDSALIRNLLVAEAGNNTLQVTFLIFVKILHETAHWMTFYNMKDRCYSLETPIYLNGEAGEFIEDRIFAGVVSHTSKSAICPWIVEFVVKNRKFGLGKVSVYTTMYMENFFQKDVIDACTSLSSLIDADFVRDVKDNRFAVLSANVSTCCEYTFHPLNPEQESTITLTGTLFRVVRDVV